MVAVVPEFQPRGGSSVWWLVLAGCSLLIGLEVVSEISGQSCQPGRAEHNIGLTGLVFNSRELSETE